MKKETEIMAGLLLATAFTVSRGLFLLSPSNKVIALTATSNLNLWESFP
jgi:hypothetical protein